MEGSFAERPSISKRSMSPTLTILARRSASKSGTMTAWRRSENGSPGALCKPDDANLLDVGRLQVVRFDFFGIDVLAVAEDDDVFLASGDEEVAVGVAVAEVAAAEPAVAIHGGGGIGPLVVSGHDDAAAKGDFADAGAAVLGRRLAVEDLHFVAGQRLADGAHHVVVGRCDAGGAAGFGHAVSLAAW